MNRGDIRRAIGLAQACELLRGRGGKPPSKKTVYNWVREGYRPRGYRGEPLVLRTVMIGADLCTLPEWIEEFESARLEMGQGVNRILPVVRTAKRAKAAQRRAAETLDRMGCR